MTTAIKTAPGHSSSSHPARLLIERRLSFPILVAALLAALVYFFVPQTVADPDIWWHLRNAEHLLHTHAFITHDMFSFTTRGAPWMDHEWLAELPFYFGWQLLGARGIFLVTVAAIETIFLSVFYLSYKKSTALLPSLLVSVLAAFLSTVSFGPRTLLFGWICLIFELLIFEHFTTHPSLIYALPLLFAIWVNTHGSWLIGIVLLAIFIAGDLPTICLGAIENKPSTPLQQRNLFIAGAISFPALFLNPYGWRLVAYPFNLAFRQKLNIANVEEWRTLDFHSARGKVFLVSLALLFLAQLLRRRKWALYELGFLSIGVYAAVTYSRFLFLAAILICPLLAKDILLLSRSPRSPGKHKRNKPALNAAMLLALAAFVVHHTPTATKLQSSGEERFPTHALPYLSHFHPQGNVFNDYLWGGFLIWHVRQVPVLIDSRVDIFEYSGVFQDYLDAVRLNNTLAILDKYSIRYVVFQRDTPLVYFLEHTCAWKVDYEDKSTTVLERRPTENRKLAGNDASH